MANTIKEKELKTDWPFTDGLTAETTRTSKNQINLIPTEGSFIPKRDKTGMMD